MQLTSVQRLGGIFRWEVTLPKGTAGQERTSIVKCGEVYTVLRDRLQGPAATLPVSMMREVDRALATALGQLEQVRAPVDALAASREPQVRLS